MKKSSEIVYWGLKYRVKPKTDAVTRNTSIPELDLDDLKVTLLMMINRKKFRQSRQEHNN